MLKILLEDFQKLLGKKRCGVYENTFYSKNAKKLY